MLFIQNTSCYLVTVIRTPLIMYNQYVYPWWKTACSQSSPASKLKSFFTEKYHLSIRRHLFNYCHKKGYIYQSFFYFTVAHSRFFCPRHSCLIFASWVGSPLLEIFCENFFFKQGMRNLQKLFAVTPCEILNWVVISSQKNWWLQLERFHQYALVVFRRMRKLTTDSTF